MRASHLRMRWLIAPASPHRNQTPSRLFDLRHLDLPHLHHRLNARFASSPPAAIASVHSPRPVNAGCPNAPATSIIRLMQPAEIAVPNCPDRTWTRHAIELRQGDRRRSADTHLLKPIFGGVGGISIYLKDELTHPTGSLKHRLAHSLFLYGICNGRIREGTLVEASSGSTAVSEAYFANLLGLPFIAVMPRTPAARRRGRSRVLGSALPLRRRTGRRLRRRGGGWRRERRPLSDQFTNAERATDWRGNNNIAEKHLQPDAGRDASRCRTGSS